MPAHPSRRPTSSCGRRGSCDSHPLPQRAAPAVAQACACWWYVLRYHRPSQLARRLLSRARRPLERPIWRKRCARPAPASLTLRSDDSLARLAMRELAFRRATGLSAADALLQGQFQFLHLQRNLPSPVDWRLNTWPDTPHLWRFHLHYHEFLLDLAARGVQEQSPARFHRAWDLVSQWIGANRLCQASELHDAWHPYCISRRLPAWIYLWSVCPPPPEQRDAVLASLFWQARYLENHLERDLGGNHLLDNVRALAVAGAFAAGPDAARWLRKAESLLRRELAEQVLPHGEHFERSPMDHAQILEGLLEVGEATHNAAPALSRFCQRTARSMAAFLQAILHPDGQIPLLGDSTFGQTLSPGQLLAWAQETQEEQALADAEAATNQATACTAGDYWLYRHEGDFLLFDAGPVGPDHLPAHAHADLLGIEVSVLGRRLFVDSGVCTYEEDEMRAYCRSTAAHNVLEIDGLDQCDVWSRFRMGYRGHPHGFRTGEEHGFAWARAGHDAYRRIGVPDVQRWMACRPGGPWFCVDWVQGTGRHELTVRLHLDPDVTAVQVAADELRLEMARLPLRLRFLAPGDLGLDQGWYCPEFGQRIRSRVVVWTARTTLPAACAWVLSWPDGKGEASLEQAGPEGPQLSWQESGRTLVWQPMAQRD